MDPFSLNFGCVGVLQAVTSCLKLAKKHAGPSAMSSVEAGNLMKTLYEFHGVMGSFQTHLEMYDDDDTRMGSLEYLKPVVEKAYESSKVIKEYLGSGRVAKTFRGAKFDRKLKDSLKSLDEAGKLFKMAILADQQTIIIAVSKYVNEISDSVDSVQSVLLNAKLDASYRDIRTWLGAQDDTDMNSQFHERNLSVRHIGSGEWLLSDGTFQDWLNASGNNMKNILWLKGAPGAGKSFLCSVAINHVACQLQGACLYNFYRFDGPSEAGLGSDDLGTGVRVAALLVDQLFRYFWRRDRRIAEHVGEYIETVEKTHTTLAEVVRLILKCGYQYSQEQGAGSATESTNVYLFLDGLDESKNSEEANVVLRLFDGLEDDLPIVRKTWISSRDNNTLRKYLDECPAISFDTHAETDVNDYLAKSVPKFNIGTETDRKIDGQLLDRWILEKLQDRAKGNFLYARLMVEHLRDGAFSIDDIIVLITSKVPNNFSEIYRRVFRQYQVDQHKYISLLFSLIVFARRPLHLNELREAMTLAMSHPSKGLDPLKVPMNLQRLFAPLIEMEVDSNSPENPLCRLCHATVHEFLTTNPDVLRVNSSPSQEPFTYTISSAQLGDLCLRYLNQQRYSVLIQPLQNNCQGPVIFGDDNARQDWLLPYCAKYWDRHLEDLKPNPELRTTLYKFLNSPNFQTLLQMQSLYVSGQFARFKLSSVSRPSRAMHRRVFPGWFGLRADFSEGKEENQKYRRDYQHFVSEWGYLLQRGSCVSTSKCLIEHFRGEVDRCLSGLLGPNNFLNRMKERYPSFMLTHDSFDYQKSKHLMIAEAVSSSNSRFMIILSPPQEGTRVCLEVWDLTHLEGPKIVSTTMIPTPNANFKSDHSQSISFSNQANTLKFGSRMLDTQDTDREKQLAEPGTGQYIEPISTDFDSRQNIIVVASRSVYKKRQGEKPARPGFSTKAQTNFPGNSNIDSSEEEADDESEEGYSSISEDENSAEETCSEGSTEVDIDEQVDETSEEDTDVNKELSESSEAETEQESEDSDMDCKRAPRPSIMINYKQPDEKKVELEGEDPKHSDDRPTWPGKPGRFRDPKDKITAALAVYDITSGQTVRMLHYERYIPAMLYHSPPVLHPFKPLVVWPVGGGEVLFADYLEKTYFVRAMMPTTRDTRHICMKAQFSPCGDFLHIASLEGQVAFKQQNNERATTTPAKKSSSSVVKKIILSLFLTTHRLSKRKTTRSPPCLVHKVKITLGQFTGFSLAKLPFTFTWNSYHLYLSVSGYRLNVYRIELFRPAPGVPLVVVPHVSVMLPLSSCCRQVYYLSRKNSNRSGLVLIGSYGGHSRVQLKHDSGRMARLGIGEISDEQVLDYPCPPVGFHIDEERDLEGWGPVNEASVMESGERFRDGKLVRKIESFNWRDDVDLEGICDICNGPLTSAIAR